jgi:hypothetical protein
MNRNDRLDDPRDRDPNRDPVTRKTDSHPVGAGTGALAGGVAGGALGATAGPAGAVVGTAVGAVAGGMAGRDIAEVVNPTAEEAYWRGRYMSEPYYAKDYSFDDYAPAYRVGYEGWSKYRGRSFAEVEPELRTRYDSERGSSRLSWENAKSAMRAAWDRVERAMPGDADKDGR